MSESSTSSVPKISEGLRQFFVHVLGDQIGGQMHTYQRRNVAQLKQIFTTLHRLPFVSEAGTVGNLSAYRRKDQLISIICQILYEDYPSCQVIKMSAETGVLAYVELQRRVSEKQKQAAAAAAGVAGTPLVAAKAASTPFPPSIRNQALTDHTIMLNAYAQQFHNPPTSATPGARQVPLAFSPKPSADKKKSPVRNKSPPKPVQKSATPSTRPIPAAFSPKPSSHKSKPPARNGAPHTTTLSARPVPPALSPSSKRSPVRSKSPPKSKKVRVKAEPRSDDESSSSSVPVQQSAASLYDSMPQNAREHVLAAELTAMGFSDRSEILSSVRKLARSGPLCELTCEDVMMDIITNREEADEARKMDEARRLSERSRKEESKRLRGIIAQTQANERKQATWSEWSSRADMYKSSWLLANAKVREVLEQRIQRNLQIKETLMEVLDLEKKSRKWYGQTLPRAYFRGTLAGRFSSRIERDSSVEQILELMKSEMSILKEAMFTLSVQQGGVPKLFVDALDSPTMVSGDDGEEEVDDEIMVVRVDGGLGPERRLSTPKSLRQQQVVQQTPDIIEIE